MAYAKYLNTNEDAFKRYRDSKLFGARMPQDAGVDAFVKYKRHKTVVALELMNEAMEWKEKNGIKFDEELSH